MALGPEQQHLHRFLLADSVTWIAVGLAIGAALLALAASAAVGVYLLRRSRRPWESGSAGVLQAAREESRRSRRMAEIASTIDLDDVLERTLGGAAGLAGVDAAMIVLPLDDEDPLVAAVGMSAEEASRQPVSTTTGGGARAVRLGYRYRGELETAGEDELIRGGIAVPLQGEGNEPAGTLAAFWRGSEGAASDAELEELAASCGPALRNARRFREARRLADLDALTSLHNRRYFHGTLARECARAGRYERRLALIVVDIDDFKAINDRIGPLAGDSVLAVVAERLRSVVRSADVPCRVGGDEFAVILPEATLRDAEQLYRRPAARGRLAAYRSCRPDPHLGGNR